MSVPPPNCLQIQQNPSQIPFFLPPAPLNLEGIMWKCKYQSVSPHVKNSLELKSIPTWIDFSWKNSHNNFLKNLKAFTSVQELSRVQLFATSWTAARQISLSITNPQSLLKLMSIESVMPSNHLILCHPLLLLPSIFPSIKVFFWKESILCIRWPKYWSFSFSIVLPMNTQDWFPLGWTGWISLQSKGLSRVFSNTTV